MAQTVEIQQVLSNVGRKSVSFVQQIARNTSIQKVVFWSQKILWVGISCAVANLAVIAVNQHLLDAPSQQVQKSASAGGTLRVRLDPALVAGIHNANVFDVELGGPKLVVASKQVSKSTTPLNTLATTWSLKGVFQGEQDYAIILDMPSQSEDVFGVGEELFQKGAFIEKILIQKSISQVVIRSGTETITLELKEEGDLMNHVPASQAKQGSTRIKPAKGSVKSGTVRQDGNNFYLTSQEVEAQLANFSQLLNQARVIPNIVNGQADGFKIDSIDKGSIFEKLGLKNNDKIYGVNGQKIENAEQAFSLLKLFRNEKEINLNIKRNDSPETLSYHIQ